MSISTPYPYTLTNGTTADATQVMANFAQIQNDVNANAANNGANNNITSLTGLTTPIAPGSGGTVTYTSTATTNTSNAYVVGTTVPNNWTNYAGNIIIWVPNATNTAGGATLAINGATACNIEKVNGLGTTVNISAGDLANGTTAICIFGGTEYILLNPVKGPVANATLTQDGSGNMTTPWYTQGTIASATTTDLGTISSQIINVTGTATIIGFGSSASSVSPLYFLTFSGSLLLTYNATSLQIPGNASITTAAGDSAIALYLGSGNWKIMSYQQASSFGGRSLLVNPQASTYAPAATDRGNIVDFTGSSNATWTMAAAATLGAGWFCYIRNSGTSNAQLLLQSSSGTIDGFAAATGYNIFTDEMRIITSDGTNFETGLVNKGYQVFLANGTFTKTPGYGTFKIEAWGGGGSGGTQSNSGSTNASGGGGGGGYNTITLLSTLISSTVPITIGAGGAAQVASGTSGNHGNPSTFGNYLTAYGGGGGAGSTGSSNGGGGGGGSTGYGITAGALGTPTTVGVGGTAVVNSAAAGGVGWDQRSAAGAGASATLLWGGGGGGSGATAGGFSYYGGGGGGGGNGSSMPGGGGNSIYGGGGGAGLGYGGTPLGTPGSSMYGGNGSASSGEVPGGGGGAGSFAGASGVGGSGQIVVTGL